MDLLSVLLLIFMIACAISIVFVKKLTAVVFLYTAFSLVASIVWLILEAPDLAITEAAVGSGISTLLFLLVLKNVDEFKGKYDKEDQDE